MVKGKCPCLPVATFPVNHGRVDDGSFVSTPHYVGNSILLYGKRSSRFPFQMFVGADYGCMIITYLLITIPTIFFLIDVGPILGVWVYVIGIATFLLTIITFSITACSDPGIIFDYLDERSEGNRAEQGESDMPSVPTESLIECGVCNLKRPRSAVHCYECGLCVDELDHHCPWTGKCIGRENIRYFHAFLFNLCTHIAFVIVVTIYGAANGFPIFKLPPRS